MKPNLEAAVERIRLAYSKGKFALYGGDVGIILAELGRGAGGELTEEMIDAPRSIILYAETSGRTIEGLRQHLDWSGVDYSYFPDWAKKETGHLTKAAIAILIWHAMESKNTRPPVAGLAELTDEKIVDLWRVMDDTIDQKTTRIDQKAMAAAYREFLGKVDG